MKTQKYQALLVSELDEIKTRLGEARMQQIYRELQTEGQEGMSRELVVQLVSRYFGRRERVKFLARHRDLIIPFLFRIKPTKTKSNGD